MRAERDDMPEWLRSRKKPSRWREYTLIALCSAATWAFIFNYAKPITIDLSKLSDAIIVGRNSPSPSPQVTAKPVARINTSEAPKEKDWDAIVESVAKRSRLEQALEDKRQEDALKSQRQTIFSDKNYKPRELVNIIPAARETMPVVEGDNSGGTRVAIVKLC